MEASTTTVSRPCRSAPWSSAAGARCRVRADPRRGDWSRCAAWALGEAGGAPCCSTSVTPWASAGPSAPRSRSSLHDALCPMTPPDFIAACVARAVARGRSAVVVGVRPVTDTVKRDLEDQDGVTVGDRTLDRGRACVAVASPRRAPAGGRRQSLDGLAAATDFVRAGRRAAQAATRCELVEAPPARPRRVGSTRRPAGVLGGAHGSRRSRDQGSRSSGNGDLEVAGLPGDRGDRAGRPRRSGSQAGRRCRCPRGTRPAAAAARRPRAGVAWHGTPLVGSARRRAHARAAPRLVAGEQPRSSRTTGIAPPVLRPRPRWTRAKRARDPRAGEAPSWIARPRRSRRPRSRAASARQRRPTPRRAALAPPSTHQPDLGRLVARMQGSTAAAGPRPARRAGGRTTSEDAGRTLPGATSSAAASRTDQASDRPAAERSAAPCWRRRRRGDRPGPAARITTGAARPPARGYEAGQSARVSRRVLPARRNSPSMHRRTVQGSFGTEQGDHRMTSRRRVAACARGVADPVCRASSSSRSSVRQAPRRCRCHGPRQIAIFQTPRTTSVYALGQPRPRSPRPR